jgi:hypothetical protein
VNAPVGVEKSASMAIATLGLRREKKKNKQRRDLWPRTRVIPPGRSSRGAPSHDGVERYDLSQPTIDGSAEQS